MTRRRPHHLADEVFDGRNLVVSITICTPHRSKWPTQQPLAEIVRDELLLLHPVQTIIGYCIMPDHVHLLLCNAGQTLGKIMNGFKGRTSRRIRAIQPDLDVWQTGYWDHVVSRNEGLYKVLLYIFLNPVRQGLVENWWSYPWLGSPLLGEVGPQTFDLAAPEDIVWHEILDRGP